MRYLNDENQVLKDFINKWSRDPVSGVDVRDVALPVENCHKQAFGLNESPLEELIEKEVKEKFIPAFRELACIPLLGEIEEPWMLSFSRKRIQYVTPPANILTAVQRLTLYIVLARSLRMCRHGTITSLQSPFFTFTVA